MKYVIEPYELMVYQNVELMDENDKLKTENAKLREDIAKARDPQRIGGQANPKSFIYAIEQLREFRWQHATNDEDAIPYINKVAEAHERENDKLRELVSKYAAMTEYLLARQPLLFPDKASELQALDEKRQELGIEVDK